MSTIPTITPTNASQRRDWASHHSRPDRSFLNLPVAFDCNVPLDHDVVRRATEAVVRRHACLRSHFDDSTGVLRQITEAAGWAGASVLREADPEEPVDRWITDEVGRAFDLRTEAPAAIGIHTGRERGSTLLVILHHIIADHISLGIVVKDLVAAIEAISTGKELDLPPIDQAFPGYVQQWTNRWDAGDFDGSLDYWRGQLAGAPEETTVPRSDSTSTAAGEFLLTVDPEVARRLPALAAGSRTTTYVIALTAFSAALAELTGADDQVFACGYANRTTASARRSVGRYVSGMALRLQQPVSASVEKRLADTHQVAMHAYANAKVSLDTVLESGVLGETASPTPFANIAFQLFPAEDPDISTRFALLRPRPIGALTSKRDLHVTAVADREQLLLSIIHRPAVIPTPWVRDLSALFQDGLGQLVRSAVVES